MNAFLPALTGLALLAAALALGPLINAHQLPQTVFFPEWAAAAGLVLAFGLCAGSRALRLPLRPAGLTLAGLALVAAGWSFAGANAGYALYLLAALAAWALGAGLRGHRMAETLAAGLFAGALLQSLAALWQLAGWPAGGLVMGKIYNQAFGNVGQANHYADLIYLGLASSALLALRGWLPRVLAVPAMVWLALAGAASASRSTLLYLLAFAAAALWFALRAQRGWRGRPLRVLAAWLGWIALCSVLAQLTVGYGHVLDVFGVSSAIERAGDAGSNGQRLYNWQAAWLAIEAHPWLGQGPASFYKAAINAMALTPPASFPKFAEHAHNLPLNLAAEFGLPVAGLVMAGLLLWGWAQLRVRSDAVRVWALLCVSVTGLHSMVEYPLWYTYLLIPFALCLGIAEGREPHGRRWALPRGAAMALAGAGLVVLVWVLHDWYALREAYLRLAAEEPRTSLITREAARAELAGVAPFSPFALQAESLRLQSWQPDEGRAPAMAARCDAHWAYKPGWFMMMRCGEAYALAQQPAALDGLARALCDGFPYHQAGLRDWAQDFDARALPGALKIHGVRCL